jgi:hypothetical protein
MADTGIMGEQLPRARKKKHGMLHIGHIVDNTL